MNGDSGRLSERIDEIFAEMERARQSFDPGPRMREVGVIASVATGVAKVSGLPGVGYEELVKFRGDVLGIAFNVDEHELGVVLLGDYVNLHAGDEVERTGRVMDVAVGEELLGRVIDPLGRPLDGKGPVSPSRRLPIERPAAAIMDRAPVTEPLQTGVKVIDALIPIGRGQRELILGDRQTGKTSIALGAILNQRGADVMCVYCAIGQRASMVAKAVAVLREMGAMDHTVVVVTEGDDPPGLAYVAPYAATSIAEYFMEAGRDVLIVYDDLTQHAQAYRELSLLLRRPPSREAFPGDIFYIHSRLLERATRLRPELGGGSLTALPIVETEVQNISAYIPTNLISITDGQIYLSPALFELGVLPAIDVGKSVSRVGGKAQRAIYREAAGDLKLAYAQFEELETFARFGARLDDDTLKIIEHGRRIRACLKQPEFSPVSAPGQISLLVALTADFFDAVPIERMTEAERAVLDAADKMPAELRARIDTTDTLSESGHATLLAIVREALAPFRPKPDSSAKAQVVSKPRTEVELKSSLAEGSGETMDEASGGRKSSSWQKLVAALVFVGGAAGWFAVRNMEQRHGPAPVQIRAVTATGVVVPAAITPIKARVSGVVEAVYCSNNAKVHANQLCAKIDAGPYQALVDKAEADLTAAKSRLQEDDVMLESVRAVIERHGTRRPYRLKETMAARKAYEQIRLRRRNDEETVARDQETLGAARASLAETDVVSTTDGTVVARDVEPSQLASAGRPLFLVATDFTSMRVNAHVSEQDLGAVESGDQVSFTIAGLPNRSFAGEVLRVDRTSPASQNAVNNNVVISALNPDLLLKPGMSATIYITITNSADASHRGRP